MKLTPVRGKVTLADGKAVQEGNVTFIPVKGSEAKAGLSAGQIKNGEYTLYTDGKVGAPEGQYKVTVTPPMMPTGGKEAPTTTFDRKYSDQATTPLMLHVPSNSYDLKLSK